MVEYLLAHDADRSMKDTKVGATPWAGPITAATPISASYCASLNVNFVCFCALDTLIVFD